MLRDKRKKPSNHLLATQKQSGKSEKRFSEKKPSKHLLATQKQSSKGKSENIILQKNKIETLNKVVEAQSYKILTKITKGKPLISESYYKNVLIPKVLKRKIAESFKTQIKDSQFENNLKTKSKSLTLSPKDLLIIESFIASNIKFMAEKVLKRKLTEAEEDKLNDEVSKADIDPSNIEDEKTEYTADDVHIFAKEDGELSEDGDSITFKISSALEMSDLADEDLDNEDEDLDNEDEDLEDEEDEDEEDLDNEDEDLDDEDEDLDDEDEEDEEEDEEDLDNEDEVDDEDIDEEDLEDEDEEDEEDEEDLDNEDEVDDEDVDEEDLEDEDEDEEDEIKKESLKSKKLNDFRKSVKAPYKKESKMNKIFDKRKTTKTKTTKTVKENKEIKENKENFNLGSKQKISQRKSKSKVLEGLLSDNPLEMKTVTKNSFLERLM